MDATDTAAPETRYCGRSQALLYNEERPHSAIGNKAPIELIDRSVAYGPR
jgi:transposase InsO family protein